ncbi:MAG TPA: hypothetical protein VFU36_01595 [Jatrophihabitans sp.]|nr:hypothetical protein [Jatrophihabitans sp.]
MTETPRDPSSPDEWQAEHAAAPVPPPPGSEPPAGGNLPPAGSQPSSGYPPPGAETPAGQPMTPGQPAVGQYPPAAGYEAAPAGYEAAPAGYQPPPAAAYQAPPPGAYQEQPPVVPGAFQAAAAGYGEQLGDRPVGQKFDARAVNPLDWGIIAAGVVAFIFSLFNFYKYTLTVGGVHEASDSVSAWHGFFGWFGVLVALLASLVLAAELIARVRFPFPTRLAVLGGYVVALICELLALLIVPGDTGGLNGAFGIKIDKGHSFGYWITLIAVIAGTALAYKRFSDTGGKLPRR